MGILQISITLLVLICLSIPLGKYIYQIISQDSCFVDPLMDKIDNFIYRLLKIKKSEAMNWQKYILHLILINAIFCLFLFIILRSQSHLGLNPNNIKNMSPDLSFNTAISFITNTDLQNYAGESGLSYFAQIFLICIMFIAPASGLAATAAFLRGLTNRLNNNLGNFYVDLTRFVTRLLLPLSTIIALILVWQGVPQTLIANKLITTVTGTYQNISLGPVATFEAIKNIASNGGGFFAANSAHPYENPNGLTNFITIVSLGLISTSLVFSFGYMLKNKKQSLIIIISMLGLLIGSIALVYYSESNSNNSLKNIGFQTTIGNMEGKETRFSLAESSLFTAATTAFQVGAVNNMHDSLTPLAGLTALWNMMLQTVFGGKGTGFLYIIMYSILTVFLCGLMVGRTPEFLSKKIEEFEVKMIALVILIHPLLILLPTVLALEIPQVAKSINNPGYHGISQVLYQFTSAAANNGSGFEGLLDNTPFWNISTGIIMFLGRYVPITALLALAGNMQNKKIVPVTTATLKTDKPIFGIMLLAIIIIIGALTFLPVLALGPIAEHLSLLKGGV